MAEAKQEDSAKPLQISYNADNRDWTKGWKLYYWRFGGGRGQYVRVMFEFCGVEYTEPLKSCDQNDWSPQLEKLNEIRGDGLNKTAFAFPIATHNDDFVISQTPAIVLFLADMFPKMKPSNPLQLARARQMMMTVADVLEEAHTASHPVEPHKGYLTQKEAADKALVEFTKKGGRMSKHLDVLTAELNRNNNGKGWFYGDSVTFIDLYVATFMRAFHESVKILKLADLYEKDDSYALLRAHRERLEATEIYQNFQKSDRMPPIDATPSFQT
eukprot:CAMPEP_0197026172 /NCGR_PEP_ID=MMETSP1384-20130603/6329_1 /TAXON_ID=29189 /ORGANISM="Ammonia sp." /LENGTH=270 /DNA_ID=CAMNT_0042454791 /DNA_START=29 /DNA_END=841 /DNA_ORIENTATION=+